MVFCFGEFGGQITSFLKENGCGVKNIKKSYEQDNVCRPKKIPVCQEILKLG